MRQVPFKSTLIDVIWRSGMYAGNRRPVTRATISRCTLKPYNYGKRIYRSFLDGFEPGGDDAERELPNLIGCTINRGLNDDAATCTLDLLNTKPLAVGELPEYPKDFDNEGWYAFNRGTSEYAGRWGYMENDWQNWLVPDRVIRTYQGYGLDQNKHPRLDDNLLITGIWLIESVKYTANLGITVECRDMAALLLEQKMLPPVVPYEAYPVDYETKHPESRIGTRTETIPAHPATTARLTSGVTIGNRDTSNRYWDSDGIVSGHAATMSLDGNTATYWVSIGNGSPEAGYSYEWLEWNVSNQQVGGVKFLPWGGGYVVYVGVYKDGKWLGDKVVPYDPRHPAAAPNDSNQPYLVKGTTGKDQWTILNLPQIVAGADKVRLTFTSLFDSNFGTYQYRAGLREMQIYNGPVEGSVTIPETQVTTQYEYFETVGDISDYTQVVRDILAIAGFYTEEPSRVAILGGPDTDLQVDVPGGVWGDLENSGTAPKTQVSEDKLDKQPLIDGINYVKEILGFNFFVDETGGAIFRSPNYWEVGCYISEGGPGAPARTPDVPVLDEDIQLLDYSVTLDASNKRKWVMIGSDIKAIGGKAQGKEYIPSDEYPFEMERNAIWIDQHFVDADECTVMADFIKIRQIFTYRRGSIKIPANPNLQIDDQIRVYERRTGESYLHYIMSIQSQWTVSGTWTMTLDTHWLGERPTRTPIAGTDEGILWVFDAADFSAVTRDMLLRQGKIFSPGMGQAQ